MSIGKIVRWHDDKGFGFVKSDDLDKDVFVHISAFPPNSLRPKVGDDVVFQVENTPKGLQVTRARYQNQLNDNVSTNAQKGNLYLELERDDNISQHKDSNMSFPKKSHSHRQSKLPNNTPLSTLYNSLILKGLKFNNFLAKNCKPSIYRALEKRVESQVNKYYRTPSPASISRF